MGGDVLKVLKEKNSQTKIIYLEKLSFNNEGKILTFPDKQKVREFVASSLALQVLKGTPSE